LPKVTSVIGLGTVIGAMLFNTATNKAMVFTDIGWENLN
jgi:hypothetical protein